MTVTYGETVPIDTPYREFLLDLVGRKGFGPGPMSVAISAADEMYNWTLNGLSGRLRGNRSYAAFRFIESSLRLFDIYRQLAEYLGGFAELDHVLDFGSGYGRLTRALVECLPSERIWVCDVDHEAVAWQVETFGVNGLVSVVDPAKFALSRQHSIVFVGSVFSHLPPDLFQRWMRKLYGLVAPKGLLAFSVNDTLLNPGGTTDEDGIAFFKQSESASLDPEIYGTTYVNQDYVARTLVTCDLSHNVQWKAFPKGLYENQLLYVVAGRDVDIGGLELVITPLGGTSYAVMGKSGLQLGGWGIDFNPRHQLVTAQAYIDDVCLASCEPTLGYDDALTHFPAAPNPPVAWRLDLAPETAGRTVRIEIKSSAGAKLYCYVAPSSSGDGDFRRT